MTERTHRTLPRRAALTALGSTVLVVLSTTPAYALSVPEAGSDLVSADESSQQPSETQQAGSEPEPVRFEQEDAAQPETSLEAATQAPASRQAAAPAAPAAKPATQTNARHQTGGFSNGTAATSTSDVTPAANLVSGQAPVGGFADSVIPAAPQVGDELPFTGPDKALIPALALMLFGFALRLRSLQARA